MRYFFIAVIFFICGLIGFNFKNKYTIQYKFLNYLKLFLDYLSVNILIYKNNLHEIINNYIIQHNNKNADFNKIFKINNANLELNANLLDEFIINKSLKNDIIIYFNSLGRSDVENEVCKNREFRNLINDYIELCKNDCKEKGDLYFKLFLALGLVIGIVMW